MSTVDLIEEVSSEGSADLIVSSGGLSEFSKNWIYYFDYVAPPFFLLVGGWSFYAFIFQDNYITEKTWEGKRWWVFMSRIIEVAIMYPLFILCGAFINPEFEEERQFFILQCFMTFGIHGTLTLFRYNYNQAVSRWLTIVICLFFKVWMATYMVSVAYDVAQSGEEGYMYFCAAVGAGCVLWIAVTILRFMALVEANFSIAGFETLYLGCDFAKQGIQKDGYTSVASPDEP